MTFELQLIAKTTIVLAFSGILSFILRHRASAATRHMIFSVGLWAALMLPAASVILPGLDLPLLPASTSEIPAPEIQIVQTDTEPYYFPTPAPDSEPLQSTLPSVDATIPPEFGWRQWLAIVWGLGSLIVIARTIGGYWEVRHLRRNSLPVTGADWQHVLQELQRDLSVMTPVQLRIANESVPPMTWGIFQPVILMPAGASQWGSERRRLVLAHELAHVKRNDGFTQIVAQLACGIYWFNPTTWYAAYRMRIERECACDDHVLSLGASSSDYADHLLDIARGLNSGFSFATVSMAHPSHLETRLRAILDPVTRRAAMSRLASAFLVVSLAGLTISVAVLQVTALSAMVLPALQPPSAPFSAAPQAVTPLVSLNPAQSQQLASIEGHVLKLGSSERLPGTRVELVKPEGGTAAYTATTAGDGRFVFSGVQPGEYRVLASRTDGLLPAEYGQKKPNTRGIPIRVSPAETRKDIRLAMAAAGAISGCIFNRDGEPVGHAQVQALRTIYREGRRIMTIAQSVQTNDLGEYRLYWLAPGQYVITARPVDTGARSASSFIRPPEDRMMHDETSGPVISKRILENGEIREEIYPVVYFPGTADLTAATEIALRPGDNLLRMDITLSVSMPVHRVRGTIVDGRTGQPAAGASIRAIPRNPGPNIVIPNGTAAPNGSFDISGFISGYYYLFAIPSGGGSFPGGATGRMLIDVGNEDLQNVTILIPPPVDIPGRFAIESSSDIDPARLYITITRDPDIFGMPRPQPMYRGGTPDPNATQADGSFTLAAVGSGDYRIGVIYMDPVTNRGSTNLPRGMYLKSIRMGNTDILREGLHIDAQAEGRLDVTMGTTDGEITGFAVNDKNEPVPNVAVVLVPEPSLRYRTDLFKIDGTDPSGRFDLKGIAPGDYKLFAWEDVEYSAWLDPEFLRDFETRGTFIRVSEVSRETRQLIVINAAR